MENTNISKINSENCYGCGACYNICPFNAIEMVENIEGFKEPFINKEKCTNCGACEQVCPVLKIQKNEKFKQKYYIGFNKDIKTRNESSSGGIFTLFANWVLKNNGYVCGATFDEKAQLKHVLINKKEDLKYLRGSKYLQSEIGVIYKEIKQKLKDNSPVLFCGTPCQVNGLLNFLNKKYDKLYTLDIVCHGVPSQRSFNEYLFEKFGTKQRYSLINFRDKRNGYSRPSFVIEDDQGKELFCGDFSESFLKGFSENLFLRKSCATCKYTTKQRVGDITIADFYNVRYKYPELNYENGISSFIINSPNGEFLFNSIKKELGYLKSVKYRTIKQPCLEKALAEHKNRSLYFSLKNISFNEKIEKCLNKKNVGIINFSDENENYGALFVAYSMKKVIEKLGYNAFNINYIRDKKTNCNPIFEDFRKKYLNLTKPCYSIFDLTKIQNQFSHIVTGGDQVFNDFLPEYTLQFVQNNINIFSYAASLGPKNLSYFLQHKNLIRDILLRFDNIAVRENSAVKILNEIGINSKSYIDSVLLLDEKEYNIIIENDNKVKLKNKKYIACMLWNFEEIKKLPCYNELSKKYEFVNILNDNGTIPSFGQFLSLIKNANYTIANSFHGIVFSILFKKQFVAVRLNDMRDDRIISLFSKLGIKQNRLFFDVSGIQKEILFEKIDYNLVMEKFAKERKKSFEYLKNSLNTISKPKNCLNVIGGGAKIYMFNKILLLKNVKKGKKINVLLFGVFPILQIKLNKKQVKLFGFIPLLKY